MGCPVASDPPALIGEGFVLSRVACGLKVGDADIAAMGVGGLLKRSPHADARARRERIPNIQDESPLRLGHHEAHHVSLIEVAQRTSCPTTFTSERIDSRRVTKERSTTLTPSIGSAGFESTFKRITLRRITLDLVQFKAANGPLGLSGALGLGTNRQHAFHKVLFTYSGFLITRPKFTTPRPTSASPGRALLAPRPRPKTNGPGRIRTATSAPQSHPADPTAT